MVNRTAATGCFIVALAALGAVACERPTTATEPPSFATAALVITAMNGSGGIGDGSPTPVGKNRQVFTLDVGTSFGAPYGQMDYVDSAFFKADGNYPHFVVGPAWPGTAILSFAQISPTCVEVGGVGYLINTGESLAFEVQACDNAQPGVGQDTFGISVPQRLVTNGWPYSAGPAPLVYGELTAHGTGTPALGIP